MKDKKFIQILTQISKKTEKVKNDISDKRLTIVEKLVVEGYLNLRNNKNQEILDSFEKVSRSPSHFVESQKLLLLGFAANNLSRYDIAKKYLTSSIEMGENHSTTFFDFIKLNALFIVYANLNDIKMMGETIEKMKKLKLEDEIIKIKMLRSLFCYHQMKNENTKAQGYCDQIDALKEKLNDSDKISFLVDKFFFVVQIEDFAQAYETLGEMKQQRVFQLTENYQYMKKLLNHLIKDEPIYSYENDFKNTPLLFHQIKVIQSLEECNRENALFHWGKLQQEIQSVYKDNFEYNGKTCLFSLCLKKQSTKIKSTALTKVTDQSKTLNALFIVLRNAKGPVHAGMIYEIIFGESATQKDQIQKISRLIYRLKMEKGVDIKFHKGTYCLASEKKKKVS